MKKKLISIGAAVALLSAVYVPAVHAETLGAAQKGKILQFGTYAGQPINYVIGGSRDVNGDGEDELFLYSKNFVSFREYAADGVSDWKTSSLRTWLNSDRETVAYTGTAPTYANQPGYLIGLSENEKRLIVPEEHKTLINNALNPDGGGSTTMGGIYPGNEQSSIINSPSDGALRKVTNFIFLQNVQEASGEFGNLFLYPYTAVGLSGTGLQLYPAATDTNNHAIATPENVSYQISEGNSKISDSGYLEFWGDEAVTVTVTSGDVSGSFTYRSIETPTGLSILNADTGEELTKITAPADSKIHLNGKATYYNKDLGGVPTAFGWWLSDDQLGTVSEDGTLILSQNAGLSGTLHIQKGAAGFDIPVQISGGETAAELYPYSEIQIADNTLSVDMFCYQSEMDSLNSQILIDGENIVGNEYVTAEEIDERHVRYTYPLSGDFMSQPHKIKAIAKTVDGYHGITTKSLTAGIENPFSDMSGHWAENIVSYMNRQSVLNGSENNGAWYFYPENSMTRAEFAVMISNYLKLSSEESSLDFKDADQIPSWAKTHVAAMANAQIISGKKADDGVYFAPNDSITRAEVIAILARTLPDKLRYVTPDYTDTADIPDWALHAFGVLKNSGLISGYEDGSIRPQKSVTRAEAATLLYNIM